MADTEGAREAARLPGFDVSADDPPVADNGVPYERFHVTLDDAPVRGPADAPVTIVMFSDFECPYCERAHATMKQVAREYPTQVRIAYKAFPLEFHSNALIAAMAARSAHKQGKFWEFHDLLYSQEGLDQRTLERHARRVDMDVTGLRAELDALTFGPDVTRDMRQARKLGVRSTPTFFVNGRTVLGAKPIDLFRAMIDEEIALARKWRSENVPADGIYAHAISEGFREVRYTEPRGIDPDSVLPVPVGNSPRRGPDTAPVTIVIFGDFECPFCARGQTTIDQVLSRYGDKIRLVYKHNPLPFHSHAFLAARAALAAHEQGKFWRYHDALYQLEAQFDAEALTKIARKLKLDMKKFRRAVDSTVFDARIVEDQQLALLLGVNGTPAYFINGRPIEGAMPLLQFRLMIEEELRKAQVLLDAGTKPIDLYDRLVDGARE